MSLQSIDGVLLLNKPLHQSSNKVLQKVKRLFNAKKAGHTGSLDPLASGMLPICFGEATKFCQFMLDADKGYTATGQLGLTTSTQDSAGEVIETKPFDHVSKPLLLEALTHFTGPIRQVPSMYSALKKDGVPLYKLARQGIEVERKARDITIHELKLIDFSPPFFSVQVRCSKGTYIRNLIDDIGEHLNAGAYVTKLHRDFSCPFEGAPQVSFSQLEKGAIDLSLLHPIQSMVSHFPTIVINDPQEQALYFGQSIELEQNFQPDGLYQLISKTNGFIGLGQYNGENSLKVKRLVQNHCQ